MKTPTQRIDEIVVQAVVVEYDEYNRPVNRVATDPQSYFRARTKDIWADLDQRLKNARDRARQQAMEAAVVAKQKAIADKKANTSATRKKAVKG